MPHVTLQCKPRTRVFILCAGRGRRWNNYLGLPKQLISFNGESILARTIRLLRERGLSDIVCVTHDPRLTIPGISRLRPKACTYLVDTLLSLNGHWHFRNIVLLGDVFFTERAMRNIVECVDEVRVFGRPWSSKLAHCRHGELFGMVFSHGATEQIESTARAVQKLAECGARGNLWDFYHLLVGLPFNSGRAESSAFRVIDDLTNDFDKPEDYIRSADRYLAATSRSRVERFQLAVGLTMVMPFHLLQRRAVAIGNKT